MVGKRSLNDVFKAESPPEGDVERGLQKPHFARFRDVVERVTAENQRTKIKTQLTEGFDRMGLEQYRKSEDELKNMSSKQVRKFYEAQNERLDAWLEVDTLVMSMSEDILGSMNPDRDDDGIAERNGALQGVGGRLAELLPQDAREQRLQAKKNASRAINVCHSLFEEGCDHVDDSAETGQRSCECTSTGCQVCCCLLFFIAVSYRVFGRLSIRPVVHNYCLDNQSARFVEHRSSE